MANREIRDEEVVAGLSSTLAVSAGREPGARWKVFRSRAERSTLASLLAWHPVLGVGLGKADREDPNFHVVPAPLSVQDVTTGTNEGTSRPLWSISAKPCPDVLLPASTWEATEAPGTG